MLSATVYIVLCARLLVTNLPLVERGSYLLKNLTVQMPRLLSTSGLCML